MIQRDPGHFSLVKLKNEITGKTNEMTVLEVLEIHIQYFKKKVAVKKDLMLHFKNTAGPKNYLLVF